MKHRRNTEESNAELVSTSQALPVLGEQTPHPVVLHCRAAWCLGHLLAAALFPWWALPISQWGHAACSPREPIVYTVLLPFSPLPALC